MTVSSIVKEGMKPPPATDDSKDEMGEETVLEVVVEETGDEERTVLSTEKVESEMSSTTSPNPSLA